jgi:pimeloyl-ACP methyl ester carboxylesterase
MEKANTIESINTEEEGFKHTLVVLHGYGGSGALFYPVFQYLIDHFHLIFVDIIGMGASSRPKDFWSKDMTPEESNEYFVKYLEKWRVNMKHVFEKIDQKNPN